MKQHKIYLITLIVSLNLGSSLQFETEDTEFNYRTPQLLFLARTDVTTETITRAEDLALNYFSRY